MKPIKHNKQPNRIIYFGTDGCVGHYPLGINFHLTRKEYKDFQEIDRIITDEVLNENNGTFLRYLSDGVPYTCFGVPYSPDDERPGSKTIVLVEYGTVQEVKDVSLNPEWHSSVYTFSLAVLEGHVTRHTQRKLLGIIPLPDKYAWHT